MKDAVQDVAACLRRIDPAAAGIAGVATAAAVLSFSSLRALAISTNTWSWIAWLLPISLDAAAATSTFVWLRTTDRTVVRLAACIAWSTIVLSVVGNGVHHAFQALGIEPWWWVALIVGAVPPAVFGAVVHLAITAAKPSTTEVAPVVELVGTLRDGESATNKPDQAADQQRPLVESATNGPTTLVEPELWRDHCPTEAEYAATILDHLPRDGQRLTQQEMLEALRVVSPDCSLYRVKQYRRSPLEVAS